MRIFIYVFLILIAIIKADIKDQNKNKEFKLLEHNIKDPGLKFFINNLKIDFEEKMTLLKKKQKEERKTLKKVYKQKYKSIKREHKKKK